MIKNVFFNTNCNGGVCIEGRVYNFKIDEIIDLNGYVFNVQGYNVSQEELLNPEMYDINVKCINGNLVSFVTPKEIDGTMILKAGEYITL